MVFYEGCSQHTIVSELIVIQFSLLLVALVSGACYVFLSCLQKNCETIFTQIKHGCLHQGKFKFGSVMNIL